MNKLKLIASDIDGTLLLNGAKEISAEAIQLIDQLHKKGILFVAASGRQYGNLQYLFAPIKDKIAYITGNGCRAIFNNEILYQQELPHQLAMEICRDVINLEKCELQISTPDIQYIIPKTKAFAAYMNNEPGIKVETIDHIEDAKGKILKIAVFCQTGIKDGQQLIDKYGTLCRVQIGRYDWLDFTPFAANKGLALKAVMKHLNIKSEQCVAFGDYYNDIEMLESVKYPIVISSAPKDIICQATQTCETVEITLKDIISKISA